MNDKVSDTQIPGAEPRVFSKLAKDFYFRLALPVITSFQVLFVLFLLHSGSGIGRIINGSIITNLFKITFWRLP